MVNNTQHSSLKVIDFKNILIDALKIQYNGEVVFDCMDGYDGMDSFNNFLVEYGDKVVYSLLIKIVDFHHTVVNIKGEPA